MSAADGSQTWKWSGFTSMDDVCVMTHDIPKATFPRKASKLTDMVTWLEQNQKVRMTCDMHNLAKKGKVWSIKPEKKIIFKVLGLDESHKEKYIFCEARMVKITTTTTRDLTTTTECMKRWLS